MVVLNDVLLSTVGAAKEILVDAVKRGRTLGPSVLVYRGNEQIAIIGLARSNRDDMLSVASVAAYAFEADMLAVVHDTWFAHDPSKNPLTGNDWQPGDMQDLVDNHDGIAKGWVSDAILVVACNRAGDQMQEMIPYRIRKRSRYTTVDWIDKPPLPEDVPEDEIISAGVIPDALTEIMGRSSVTQEMAKNTDLGEIGKQMLEALGAEVFRAHQDCAAVKLFADPPSNWGEDFPRELSIVLSAEEGTERARVIQESLGA